MDYSRVLTVCFLVVGLSACATDQAIEEISQEFVIPDDIEEVVFQAKKAEIQGQYQKAIEQYKEALVKNEADLAARVGLAGVYLRQGVLEEAEVMLTSVIADKACVDLKREPDDQLATTSLADAIEDREERKKRSEYCGVAWNGIGVIYDISSDYAEAEKHYLKAISYKPDDAAFYNNYGYSLIMAHRYEEAEEVLRQGYSLAPNSKRIRNNLAFSQAWARKYDQALETFSETLDDPEAYNNIGYIALLSHDYGKAIDLFEYAIELSPAYYVKASYNLKKAQRLKRDQELRDSLLKSSKAAKMPEKDPEQQEVGQEKIELPVESTATGTIDDDTVISTGPTETVEVQSAGTLQPTVSQPSTNP
jgi:Flp pilus assembly protein TadD